MKTIIFSLLLAVTAQATTVTLNGVSYTVQGHPRTLLDGPGGVIDASIKDPDGSGSGVAPKAVSTNPAWVMLAAAAASALPNYAAYVNREGQEGGTAVLEFASYWYADNSQTASLAAAEYMLNNIEQFVPRVCIESIDNCGAGFYNLTSYGIAYWLPNWILAYELIRGQMTGTQQALFASKMLNDNSTFGGIDGAAGTSCTNGTVTSSATATLSYETFAIGGTLTSIVVTGGNMQATITGTTTGMHVGTRVRMAGAPFNEGPNATYPIVSIDSSTQFTFGYTSSANGTYTNAGMSVAYLQTYITTSSAVFGSSLHPGDWIATPQSNPAQVSSGNFGVVDTVIDSTHAFLGGGITPAGINNETMYTLPGSWVTGQCGYVWVVKHDDYTAQVLTYSGGVTLYPPSGGSAGLDGGLNLVYSNLWGLHMIYLSVLDDDANESVRSGAELTTGYNWWYANQYATAETLWTGFHQSGSGYGIYRAQQFMPGTAIAVSNSVLSPPPLLTGLWARNAMALSYVNAFPNAQGAQMQWGQQDVSAANMIPQWMRGFAINSFYFRNTTQGQYANWWLFNMWATQTGFGNTPGTSLSFTNAALESDIEPYMWIFTNQNYTQASLSGTQDTFLWNASDTGTTGHRADTVISRTGYMSATDTLTNFYAQSVPECDHNVECGQPSNYGSYKIFKGWHLLGEDYQVSTGMSPGSAAFVGVGSQSNYIQLGGTDSNVSVSNPILAGIPRAAGTNDYAYGMADVTQAYVSAAHASHVYRHLVDFKLTGTQQFLIDFMDVLTSAGQTKTALYHYPNLSTTSYSSNVVTSTNSVGNATQLLTQVLAPQAVYVASGSTGTSYQIAVCPSTTGTSCDATNTQAYMAVVHMPVTGTGNSLPSVHLVSTIDSNHIGIEVDGSSPKIAVFAKAGTEYNTASFTATHSGTAQILIAGITPGSGYAVTQNGSVLLSGLTVGSDGTTYFTGTSGTYTLGPVQATGTSLTGVRISGGTTLH